MADTTRHILYIPGETRQITLIQARGASDRKKQNRRTKQHGYRKNKFGQNKRGDLEKKKKMGTPTGI